MKRALTWTVVAVVLGSSGMASAFVPGWSRFFRTTRVDVSNCAASAQEAIRSVTGVTATTSRFNGNTIEIRGFTANEGIFAYCTASTSRVCNLAAGDLTILVFSGNGSGSATTIRDRVNSAFGDPRFIDCGAVPRPV